MSRTRAVLATLGAASAAVAMVTATAMPAHAAKAPKSKAYTVKVGTNKKGTFTATGATTGASPQIKFVIPRNGLQLGCASGSATTSVTAGKNTTGVGLAKITATQFNSCTGPAGIVLGVTQVGTWSLDSKAKVAAGADVVGSINNVSAHLSSTSGPACSFDVTGSVAATFKQTPTSSQALSVGGSQASNLTISNVSGCVGAIVNGDQPTFAANYAITSPSGAISIVGGPILP